MELTEEQKGRVRFDVCHAPEGAACLNCVLEKLISLRRIIDHPMASKGLQRMCGAEAMYALQLLPEQYDVKPMVAKLQVALDETGKAQVIH